MSMIGKWTWKLFGLAFFLGAIFIAHSIDNSGSTVPMNNSAKIYLDINFKNLSKIFFLRKIHALNATEILDLNIKGRLQSPLFSSKVLIQPNELCKGRPDTSDETYSLNILFQDEFLSTRSFLLMPRFDRLDVFERLAELNKQTYTTGALVLNGKTLSEHALLEKLDINYALKRNFGPGKILSLNPQEVRTRQVDNQKELDTVLSQISSAEDNFVKMILFAGDRLEKEIFLGIEPTECH